MNQSPREGSGGWRGGPGGADGSRLLGSNCNHTYHVIHGLQLSYRHTHSLFLTNFCGEHLLSHKCGRNTRYDKCIQAIGIPQSS